MTTFLADTFTRADASGGWGTAETGGAWTHNVASAFSISSNKGRVTVSAANTYRIARAAGVTQDGEIAAKVAWTVGAQTAGGSSSAMAVLRYQAATGDMYYATLRNDSPSGAVKLRVYRFVGSTSTALGSSDITIDSNAYTPGTQFSIRFRVDGTAPTRLRARAWLTSSTEPSTWQVDTTDADTALQTAGQPGLRAGTGSAYTATVSWNFDDLTFTDATAGGAWTELAGVASMYVTTTATLSGGSPSTLLAVDEWARTLTDSWGNADVGGTYSYTSGGQAAFDVAGGVGTIAMSAGQFRLAHLPAIDSTDVDAVVRLEWDQAAAGATCNGALVARRRTVDVTTYWYQCIVRNDTTGHVRLRWQTLAGSTATNLGSDYTHTAGPYTAGTKYWLRIRVTGTGTTRLRARIWNDGSSEPSTWHLDITDTTTQLQGSGNVGIRAGANTGFTPATVIYSFDHLNAQVAPPDTAYTELAGTATCQVGGGAPLLRSVPMVRLWTEVNSSGRGAAINAAADAAAQAAQLAGWYVHAHAEASNQFPMGDSTKSGSGPTIAARLAALGMHTSQYRNGSYISQASAGQVNFGEAATVEQSYRPALAVFWAGQPAKNTTGRGGATTNGSATSTGSTLKTAVTDTTSTTIYVRRCVDGQAPTSAADPDFGVNTWPFRPSRGTGAGSGTQYSTDTRNFVAWIRIDSELMRVTAVSYDSGNDRIVLTVDRGWWGSTAATHSAGAKVFSPAYIGSTSASSFDTGLAGAPNVNDTTKALRYVLKLWTQEAVEFTAARIRATFGTQGYNAVWLDVTSPFPYNNSDPFGYPVWIWDEPRDQMMQTDPSWSLNSWGQYQRDKIYGTLTGLGGLDAEFPGSDGYPDYVWYANSQGGQSATDGTAASARNTLMGYLDGGGVLEFWLQDQALFQIQMAQHLYCQANNLPQVVWAKTSQLQTGWTSVRQYRRFAYGAYLLGWRPTATKAQFGSTWDLREPDLLTFASDGSQPDKLVFWDLGSPSTLPTALSQMAETVSGTTVYRRDYQRGAVIVNPNATSVSYTLAESWYDLSAGTPGNPPLVTGTITIGPWDALFLGRSGATTGNQATLSFSGTGGGGTDPGGGGLQILPHVTAAAYRLFAGDLTGKLRAEIPFAKLKYEDLLDKPGSAHFSASLADPAVTRWNLDPGRTAVWIDRNGQIVWGGILWAARPKSRNTIDFACEGWLSYWSRRTIRAQKTYTQTDPIGIARDLIAVTQADTAGALSGNVGLAIDYTVSSTVLRDVEYAGNERKPVAEAIAKLAELQPGFDFGVSFAWDSESVTKTLRFWSPARGQDLSGSVVLRSGENVVIDDYQVSAKDLANRVDVLGAGDGPSQLVGTRFDDSLPHYPILDQALSSRDLDTQVLVDAQAAAVLAQRRLAPDIGKVTLLADSRPGFGDATVGDTITVDVDDGYWAYTGQARIVGVEVEVDTVEKVTWQLSDPARSGGDDG